jgi:hypothetical protein
MAIKFSALLLEIGKARRKAYKVQVFLQRSRALQIRAEGVAFYLKIQ